jgi:hypothetical protein
MPKFKDDVEWVKNLAHSIAVANGHDDPAGYAAKVAEIHAAKEAEPQAPAQTTEGEGNGAT